MRNYHITYFIERGNPEEGIRPLLGGMTLEAFTIIAAIFEFMKLNNIEESEIKYIVEL
tara:strand:+ start:654 stop:827 length:174 start_codon:yes stop_codon:yes gene_type:complete